MTDDSQKAEELWQGAKEQSRHTSEPVAQEADDAEPMDRVEAIADALLDVEAGEIPENINIRDARLKALLVGLDRAGELDHVVEQLGGEGEDATHSDLARQLIRSGLKAELPDVWADAKEARRTAKEMEADQQPDDF